MDGARILEAIAAANKEGTFEFFNASNGIEIKGWKPCAINDLKSTSSLQDNQEKVDQFSLMVGYLSTHSSEDLRMRWNASRPRESIFKKSQDIVNILKSDETFFPNKLTQIAKSISISTGTPAEQLFPRVARGQIVKVLAAIYRQKIVMTDSQDEWLHFEKLACNILADRILKIRYELFELCDILETLVD